MALSLQIQELLGFTAQPAFCVKNGVVAEVNPAAQGRGILPQMHVDSLLRSGSEDYSAFQDGQLFLTVGVGEHVWDACVRQLSGVHIFVLEQNAEHPELQALSRSARTLRGSLSMMASASEHMVTLCPSNNPEVRKTAGYMNKALYQMQRELGNMSDAARYRSESAVHPETVEICSFLREIFEKAATHMEQSDTSLTFETPCGSIPCLVDTVLLERAVYNLLSNAKEHAADSDIQAKLLQKGNRLYLTVTDHGPGIPSQLFGSMFTRYLDEPSYEDSRLGVGTGLGYSLICSAARAMEGTVLVQQPESGGTKVTLAFPIRQAKGLLRSDVMKIDYAGERDHALIEFSGFLPSSVYED